MSNRPLSNSKMISSPNGLISGDAENESAWDSALSSKNRVRWKKALVFSHKIYSIPRLNKLLPEYKRIHLKWPWSGKGFDTVLGWGFKGTAQKARNFAAKKGIPYLALEDGFVRSVAPGCLGESPLSLVLDDQGIYYDAHSPSRLETILEEGGWETPDLLARAQRLLNQIVKEKISKYNHASFLDQALPGSRKEKVLLVDQTFGDSSIVCGMADETTFEQMLTAALEENPEADIIIKTHPDVIAGKKRGYLCDLKHSSSRIHILAEDLNPLSVLEKADRIYVVTSQMGFEALLLGKPVECFGMPFYAGWGLTRDRQSCPRRTKKRTVEELFAAAYILYPRYLNPQTGQPGSLENVIEHLLRQRRVCQVDAGHLVCTGFQWWKRLYIRHALSIRENYVIFSNRPRVLSRADKVVVWGAGERSELVHEAEKHGIPVHRMEDGFLRSVGLGSDLVRPLSLVVDTSGIYFDPSAPSDLETILRETDFSTDLKKRGAAMRKRIVEERLSKYNVGDDSPPDLLAAPGQRIILVPGQVEDDASIRLGCVDIRTNLDLLVEVRRQNPEAYIVHKPHPDVLAGNRKGGIPTSEALKFCDQIITETSMPACLRAVDEVHTLTSLTGFEALLHGKTVSTYGLPFYAGWGLTRDRHQVSRRGRKLELDELITGALILYPRYIDWGTGHVISPEAALEYLKKARGGRGTGGGQNGFMLRWRWKLSGFFEGIRKHRGITGCH
jgi:capsular polysaccharide export protein